MPTKQPCRLIAYYRVSTAKQGASGLGLEAQEAAVKAHVASTGCQLVGSYVEVESGRKSDRTELGRAILHARRAKAVLVIAKMDRLSRNLHFITGLQEAGVPFVACDNPNANELTVHLLAAVAQFEAKAISERTKSALQAAKARGVKLGKPENRTYEGGLKGSRRGIETIQKNREESDASILPIILALRAEGLGCLKICQRLNAMGEQTRHGKRWTAMGVLRILKRQA